MYFCGRNVLFGTIVIKNNTKNISGIYLIEKVFFFHHADNCAWCVCQKCYECVCETGGRSYKIHVFHVVPLHCTDVRYFFLLKVESYLKNFKSVSPPPPFFITDWTVKMILEDTVVNEENIFSANNSTQ